MKFTISDDMILQFYGIVILIITLNTWTSISSLLLIPAIWIACLCAAIVYHRQLKIAISVEWIFSIWLSLFFPKFSDPVVTTIGKLHCLILLLLLLIGVDSLVNPVDTMSNVSQLGKICWVVSLIIAGVATLIINKYRPNKKQH